METTVKYHFSTKTNKPEICKAKNGNCQYEYFANIDRCQQYADNNNEIELLKERLEITDDEKVKSNINRNIHLLTNENNELKYEEISESLKDIESIDFEFDKLHNWTHKDGFYDISNFYGKTYRGESNGKGKINSGLALYGAGVYSATKKSVAKEYGKVRVVDRDELPQNPLCLKNGTALSQFEQELCNHLGITKKYLYKYVNIDDVVRKCGYDGIVVGDKKSDLIIVKFFDK